MVTMATWFNITDWLYGRGLWPHGGLEVPIQMEKKMDMDMEIIQTHMKQYYEHYTYVTH